MPELPPLATTEQLATWMQVTPEDLPVSASLVLDVASAIVRGEARQSFTRRTTTVTLYPRDGVVTLPQRPVVSVDAVTGANSWIRRHDKLFVGSVESVRVTYTHGYAKVPGDVLGVLLTAVTRVLTNPNDLRQETAGSLSVTYAAETIGASLSPADRDLLGRYRRRAAVS